MSPKLIDLYDLNGKIVVVVDILRATSVMVTALAHGAREILPVATLEEARSHLKKEGFLCAAERGGDKVEDFPFDNSPFSYMCESVKGSCIVMTTTNGTLAITKSKSAAEVIIGAFLNIEAVANYLKEKNQDVIIHCAGWKGKTNMEDTLFAGALVELLTETHQSVCDTPLMANTYYRAVSDHMKEAIKNSAHAKRLGKLNIEKDIEFCSTMNLYDVVPRLKADKLTAN